jgi:hypothetical protein
MFSYLIQRWRDLRLLTPGYILQRLRGWLSRATHDETVSPSHPDTGGRCLSTFASIQKENRAGLALGKRDQRGMIAAKKSSAQDGDDVEEPYLIPIRISV